MMVHMLALVHQPPPSFTDIQSDTIGKPPNLPLSLISAPDPDQKLACPEEDTIEASKLCKYPHPLW